MTHHRYILTILIAGVFSWVAFLLVLFKLSPMDNTKMALLFFFLSLFVALSCSFAVIGFYLRVWLFKNEIFYKHINISIRQGVILSLITVFSLVFQLLKVLTWWSGLLLVFIALLIEFYFSSRDSSKS